MKKIAILTVSALLLVTACKKEEEAKTEDTPATAIPEGPYKASYSVDGRGISFADGSSGYISPSATMNKMLLISGGDTILSIRANYSVTAEAKGSIERIVITTDTLNFIDSTRYTLTRPSFNSFAGMFTGVRPFAQKGMTVTYYAPDNSVWNSNGAQTGTVNFSEEGRGILASGVEFVSTVISFDQVVVYKVSDPTLTKTLTGGNIKAVVLNSK